MLQLQSQLERERTLKRYKAEFEAICKEINKYPAAQESLARISECKAE